MFDYNYANRINLKSWAIFILLMIVLTYILDDMFLDNAILNHVMFYVMKGL